MSDQTVAIGGREFRIGATYAPKPKEGVKSYRRKTLLKVRRDPWSRRQECQVIVSFRNKNGSEETCSSRSWVKWAGEELPDA